LHQCFCWIVFYCIRYTDTQHFVYPLTNQHIYGLFLFWRYYKMLLWAFTCKSFCGHMHTFLLDIKYHVKGLQGNVVSTCWIF
jgi:hypothetical protein